MPMKKTVSTFLSVLILFVASVAYMGCACVGVAMAADEPVGGETVYISSESDFINFMLACSSGVTDGNSYVLTSDIYLARYYAGGGNLSLGKDAVLGGSLDGRGHAIVGLTIGGTNGQSAFFKEISPSGSVKNLILADVSASGSDVAALAVYNFGTVTDVRVEGELSGDTAAGIAVFNFGTIEDCVTAVTLNGSDAAAFAAISNGTEAEALIPAAYISAGYAPSYKIAGCYGLSGQKAAIYVSGGTVEALASQDAAADGTDDYVLLKWYIDAYSNATAGAKPRAEQTAYINCYNVALTSEENAALEEAINNGNYTVPPYGFLNAENTSDAALKANYTDFSEINGIPRDLPAQDVPVGSGTESDPFLIADLGDLLGADALDAEGVYFLLTSDISLYISATEAHYPADGAFFTALKGTFDGNGKTISALAGAFAEEITSAGKVKDLNVIGRSSSGLITENNAGTVERIAAYGAGYAVYNNAGTVTRSTVGTGDGVAYESSGSVSYTRHYGGAFFALSGAKAEYCYNLSGGLTDAWNADSLLKCVSVNSDGVINVSSDTDISSLVTVNTNDKLPTAAPLYSTGWKFASATGWAFRSGDGNGADVPVLVFPEDNVAYKGVTYLKAPVASYSREYGSVSYSESAVLYGMDNTDEVFQSYPVFPGDDSDIRYEQGTYYYGLSSGAKVLPTYVFEYIVDSRVSPELLDLIEGSAGADYTWYIVTGSGEKVYEPDEDLGTAYPQTYKFRIAHELIWVTGTVRLTAESTAEFEYTVVQYGLPLYDAYADLRLNSLTNSLEALGLVRTGDSADPLGFEGVERKWYFLGEEYTEALLYDIGAYTLTVDVPSTVNSTAVSFSVSYAVEEGTLDLDGYSVVSSLGGFSESDAPVYNGTALSVPQSSFSIDGFVHYGAVYGYEILAFRRYDGTAGAKPTEFLNAGIYTLKLTLRVPNYAPLTREFDFYVARKTVTINPVLSASSIIYYGEHPTVTFTSADYGDATSSMFPSLTYSTTYKRGDNANTAYAVSVTVSKPYENSNYIALAGADVTFYVERASLDLSACGFTDTVVTYDGKSHSLALDISKIKLASGDNRIYSYTLTYAYSGASETASAPFAFVNAGTYAGLSVTVGIQSDNYNTAYVIGKTLTVTPLGVTLEAEDVYVNYGFDAEYKVRAYRTDGGEETEDYLANLILGEHYSIGSDYVKNVTKAGSVLPVTVALLGEGNAIGNYSVTVSSAAHYLTVGKRSYIADMKDTYIYTGAPVVLDFNGENLVFDEGYPKYYIVSGGKETAFSGVPTDANTSANIYKVYLKISETDEFYALDKAVEFTITPVETVLSGLYVKRDGMPDEPLTDGLVYAYCGEEFVIGIDNSELGKGASYKFTYRYRLYDDYGEEYYYESDKPVTLKDAVRIKDVTLTLESLSQNYTSWSSTEDLGLIVTSFTIAPLEVSFASVLGSVEYKGGEYTDDEIAAYVNALPLNGVLAGDLASFAVIGGNVALPGDYDVTVTSLNGNYVFGEGRETVLKFTVVAATVTLDFAGLPEAQYVYGEVYGKNNRPPEITLSTEFTLGGKVRTETLTYVLDTSLNYPAPSEYALRSANPLVMNGVETVRFVLTGAEKAVRILPREVTFDWSKVTSLPEFGFVSEYVYTGVAVNMPSKFVSSLVNNPVPFAEDPLVTITYSGELKHAGTYTLTATATRTQLTPDGEALCYVVAEELREFTVTIRPVTVRYYIEPRTIYLGGSIPDDFVIGYEEGAAPIEGDVLSVAYDVPGFDSAAPKAYAVYADVRSNDGGKLYADYVAEKLYPQAKELTVDFKSFPSETVAPDVTAVYTGKPVEIPVYGIPEGIGATVSYSFLPTERGEYEVTVTVSAEGYADKVMNVRVTVNPALPEIKVTEPEKTLYTANRALTSEDITTAEAYFDGVKIAGTFRFSERIPAQTLVYGRHTYAIDFLPESDNFSVVRNIAYVFETYVDVNAAFDLEGNDPSQEGVFDIAAADPDTVTELTALHTYEIRAAIAEYLTGAALLYVNGTAVLDNVYTVTETEELTVEVRIGMTTLMTRKLKVTVTEPADTDGGDEEEPSEPAEPGDQDGKPSGGNGGSLGGINVTMSEETKRKWIIGGSVSGGILLLGGVAAITVVTVVKKKKNKQ